MEENKKNKKYCWIVKSVSDESIIVYHEDTNEERRLTWADFGQNKVYEKHKLSTQDKCKLKDDGKYYVKRKKLFVIIFIIFLALFTIGGCFALNQSDSKDEYEHFNRYVEEVQDDDVNNTIGQTRFKFNTTVHVKKNTIQDLGFKNINEGKTQVMKIKLNDDYVFDSKKIPFKKQLTADVLLKKVNKGEHDVLAEVYTYNDKDVKVNQTNFKMKMVVE